MIQYKIVKLLHSLLVFVVFLFLLVGFFHPLNAMTQDLGRHLLTGKIIIETKNVPKTNLYSYTYSEFPFVNHHWLSEVVFYETAQTIGFNGLLLFTTSLVLISFGLLFWYATKNGDALAGAIVSFFYLQALFERTDVRPELFSFFFLSIFIVILFIYRKRYTRWIFLLPFLELVWVNMHIYFPIGILLIGLFLVDRLYIWTRNTKKHQKKHIYILFIVFLLSLVVAAINPNGLRGALYPFTVFQNYGYQIQENQNIFFLWNYSYSSTILFFFFSFILLLVSLFINLKKTRFIDWLLTLVFAVLAATSIRNLPLFVFATYITAAYFLSLTIKKYNGSKKTILVIYFSILFLIMWDIGSRVNETPIGFGMPKAIEKAARFYKENNIQGPVFNNFDIGSYLEYQLYPNQKVFVDGRPEAYPHQFFENIYIPMQENNNVFKKYEKTYMFNSIVFSYTDQTPWAKEFLKTIWKNPEWKIVYANDSVIIFVKNVSKNKQIIAKYGMDISSFQAISTENTIPALMKIAYLYQVFNLPKKELEVNKQMLLINPNYCPALQNILFLSSYDPSVLSIYQGRYNQFCR